MCIRDRPWYTEKFEFDRAFVGAFLNTVKGAVAMVSYTNERGATPQTVLEFIHALAQRRERQGDGSLNSVMKHIVRSDVERALKNLVADRTLAVTRSGCYFLPMRDAPADDPDPSLVVPCFQCPVRERCGVSPTHSTNPRDCVYVDNWVHRGVDSSESNAADVERRLKELRDRHGDLVEDGR